MTLIILVVLVALWAGLAPSCLPLASDHPRRLPVPTADGWTLNVYVRPAAHRRFQEPVVLCHGLANNARFMEFLPGHALARFLSAAGFDCYSVDLRGAGHSTPPPLSPEDASFDDYATQDVPAVLKAVRAHSGAERVFWVGHSMGGLVALAGADEAHLAGLVTVGSPVFFEFPSFVPWLLRLAVLLSPTGALPMRWMAQALAPMAGWFRVRLPHLPANLDNLTPRAQRVVLAHVFADIWRGVLVQFLDWAVAGDFRSGDRRVDYRARAGALTVPLLVVGGSVDVLAPPTVVQRHFELLTSPDKSLVLLGKAHGQREEYGHGDLLLGTFVEEEVFPRITGWLEARATPVAG